MTNVYFTCEGFKDVSEFITFYSNIFPIGFQEHHNFKDEKNGAFSIIRTQENRVYLNPKHELKDFVDLEKIAEILTQAQNLVIENQNLAKKVQILEKEILKVQPKQDLSINTRLVNEIEIYREMGDSYQQIADKLNADGYTNSRGNKLNSMQVKRLFDKQNKV